MDTIDKQWLEETNHLANMFEDGELSISRFTNDQLLWLIYWNFGYSGAATAEPAKLAMNELAARGRIYDQNEAEAIEQVASKFY